LRDEQVSRIDHLSHVPIEQRQQKRTDVRTVDVGIGCDDDFFVPDFRQVECLTDRRTKRDDDRLDFLDRYHLVESRSFHILWLTLQRQNRLSLLVAALFCRSTRRVSLYDEDLRIFCVF